MAGYTGFSVGIVRNTVAFIPITTLIKAGVNRVSMLERMWQRLMAMNRQTPMVNQGFEEKAKELVLLRRDEKQQIYNQILEEVKNK